MGELPEGPRGRALAVAILLVAIGTVWAGVAQPLTDWYAERRDALERQGVLARRMGQVAATVPALREAAASVGAATPVAVLEGGSDAVAGAALQQLLQQIGTGLGAVVASTEVLPGEPVGGYRRISVRMAVTAYWPVIVRLLAAIDGNTPRLLVNDLQIQSQRASINDSNPLLTVTVVVFGFRADSRPPGAVAAAPDPAAAGPITNGSAEPLANGSVSP